jgi:hypothetical protein
MHRALQRRERTESASVCARRRSETALSVLRLHAIKTPTPPGIPINVSADNLRELSTIRAALTQKVEGSVRWIEQPTAITEVRGANSSLGSGEHSLGSRVGGLDRYASFIHPNA